MPLLLPYAFISWEKTCVRVPKKMPETRSDFLIWRLGLHATRSNEILRGGTQATGSIQRRRHNEFLQWHQRTIQACSDKQTTSVLRPRNMDSARHKPACNSSLLTHAQPLSISSCVQQRHSKQFMITSLRVLVDKRECPRCSPQRGTIVHDTFVRRKFLRLARPAPRFFFSTRCSAELCLGKIWR